MGCGISAQEEVFNTSPLKSNPVSSTVGVVTAYSEKVHLLHKYVQQRSQPMPKLFENLRLADNSQACVFAYHSGPLFTQIPFSLYESIKNMENQQVLAYIREKFMHAYKNELVDAYLRCDITCRRQKLVLIFVSRSSVPYELDMKEWVDLRLDQSVLKFKHRIKHQHVRRKTWTSNTVPLSPTKEPPSPQHKSTSRKRVNSTCAALSKSYVSHHSMCTVKENTKYEKDESISGKSSLSVNPSM